ncbi:MAG: DUF1049 domain-containing protein [Nitrospinae bacterium]|nr:DUF1049 domain-containing protein [Nitrospinota bacterium]
MADNLEKQPNGLMAVKLALGLLLVFFIVSFAAKNQQNVLVSYYFGHEYNAPVWFVVVFSFLSGALLASLLWAISLIREKGRSWSLSRKNAKLEDQLRELTQKPPVPVEKSGR